MNKLAGIFIGLSLILIVVLLVLWSQYTELGKGKGILEENLHKVTVRYASVEEDLRKSQDIIYNLIYSLFL